MSQIVGGWSEAASAPAGVASYQLLAKAAGVRHFHEKLREEHGIELSYTWVKVAL